MRRDFAIVFSGIGYPVIMGPLTIARRECQRLKEAGVEGCTVHPVLSIDTKPINKPGSRAPGSGWVFTNQYEETIVLGDPI